MDSTSKAAQVADLVMAKDGRDEDEGGLSLGDALKLERYGAASLIRQKNANIKAHQSVLADRDAEISKLREAAIQSGEAFDKLLTELEAQKRMFMAACEDLGAITDELGLDPDEGGADPIICAIEDLKSERDDALRQASALATPASPASAPEASELDAIAQRTEEIRLRHGFPHTSRKQLAYDVECLLAHIAMMRAQLDASEESRMELLRLLNEEASGDTFMGEPVLPPRPDVSGLVSRFLGWRLPDTFSPDCGISFDGRKDDEWNKNKTWPVGTNLLNAEEAKAMFQHCLAAPLPPVVARKELTNAEIRTLMHNYSRMHQPGHYSDTEFDCLQDVIGFVRAAIDAARLAGKPDDKGGD